MEPCAPTPRFSGQAAEDAACDWLASHGFLTVCRNFRCRRGEADLIMAKSDVLVFAEVRFRAGTEYGGAAASVTRAKQQKIIAAARYFLHHRPRFANHAVRFDVIAMTGQPGNWQIQWIPAAFLAE